MKPWEIKWNITVTATICGSDIPAKDIRTFRKHVKKFNKEARAGEYPAVDTKGMKVVMP